jgi:predicted component of type VI protein secretion system
MAAPKFQVTMRSGPTPGKIYPIDLEDVRVGRDLSNNISISDPEVSRHHARFFIQNDNVFVEDLGSTNGTFLNGERISTPQQLRTGDVVTFGENIVMVYEKVILDTDATVVSAAPIYQEPQPVSQPYKVPSEEISYPKPEFPAETPSKWEPAPVAAQPAAAQPVIAHPEEPKKRGMPSWMLVLIIAIVVLACVIAVTLYFMPASWWCAITFDMLAGCPIP